MTTQVNKTATPDLNTGLLTNTSTAQSPLVPYLKRLPIVRKALFHQALKQAFQAFAEVHPDWADSLFDEHFLLQQAPRMEKQYCADGRLPTPLDLAVAWHMQLGNVPKAMRQRHIADVQLAASYFVAQLQEALDEVF